MYLLLAVRAYESSADIGIENMLFYWSRPLSIHALLIFNAFIGCNYFLISQLKSAKVRFVVVF